MSRTNIFRLALVAIAELVMFGGGIALVLTGQKLAGFLMIIIGAVLASVLTLVLVLKGRQQQGGDST